MSQQPEEASVERKKSIFIGSSTESLRVARALKSLLDKTRFDINIWDEDVFEKGRSNIDNLLKFSDVYDYAIFVFVPDDEIVIREATGTAPRHNIVFEFGLFLGRIGAKKTFIVAEESIKKFVKDIFTDLQGISLGHTFKFDYKRIANEGIDDELRESLFESANEINQLMVNTDETLQLGFLPSTALSIGYYENFIKQVYTHLQKLRTGAFDQRIKLKLGKIRLDMYSCDFQINIIIPTSLDQASHDNLSANLMKLGLVKQILKTTSREFAVYHEKDLTKEKIKAEGLKIYDIPTTLYSSLKAIELITKEDLVNSVMSKKEITNFFKTLEIKLKSEDNVKEHVTIVTFKEVKKSALQS